VAAVLEDDRYAYPLVVDSLPDRGVWAREALLGVVASIEPIPRPRAERFFSTPMGHWAE
jgi:hypothetical protein